jgi:hypothetical protein
MTTMLRASKVLSWRPQSPWGIHKGPRKVEVVVVT